jgi:hypothetical protein
VSVTPAQTTLPTKANDAFELRDVASGLSVAVALRGASGGAVEVAQGYVVYPVPTVTFNVLYMFFVLSLERRRKQSSSISRPTWGSSLAGTASTRCSNARPPKSSGRRSHDASPSTTSAMGGARICWTKAPPDGRRLFARPKRLSTTDKYLRPSRRAAERALAAVAVAVTTSVPSPPEARPARILAPLWHRRGVAGGPSDDGDPEKTGVTDGFRTRDNWSHNPVLYQLSYGHRTNAARHLSSSGTTFKAPVARLPLRSGRTCQSVATERHSRHCARRPPHQT